MGNPILQTFLLHSYLIYCIKPVKQFEICLKNTVNFYG